MRLDRIEMPNADPAFVATLAAIVRRALAVPSNRMKPGEIRVDRASRRFRVQPQPVRTLKELSSRRRAPETAEVWALRDVSLAVEPGEAVGLDRPQRLRQDDAAQPDRRDHHADLGPGRGGRPGRVAARARRRLPPRLHGPRERLPQRVASTA